MVLESLAENPAKPDSFCFVRDFYIYKDKMVFLVKMCRNLNKKAEKPNKSKKSVYKCERIRFKLDQTLL